MNLEYNASFIILFLRVKA